jgi:hypothetical protein
MRDTGDPTTSGGMIEWGYYEENPRLCHPRDISKRSRRACRPAATSTWNDPEPLERDRADADPGRAGYNEQLLQRPLQVTADGDPRSASRRCAASGTVAIWVRTHPAWLLVADWMTDGARIDHARSTMPASAHQLKEAFIEGRAASRAEDLQSRRPSARALATGRNVKRSPFYERERALGGSFMELGGWERAHGYAANEHLLKYGNRVPVRENEWDSPFLARLQRRHLAMRIAACELYFYMFDVEGPTTSR